jgi:hypothetical protein
MGIKVTRRDIYEQKKYTGDKKLNAYRNGGYQHNVLSSTSIIHNSALLLFAKITNFKRNLARIKTTSFN